MRSIVSAMMIVASLLPAATTESATTITRIGKKCQVCIETDGVRVCRHYNRCPVPEKKSDE
jgi:hypothetical protein